VVHQSQGLALGLEAGDDLAGVHAGLDDLEGDLAVHGLALLGHPDLAHAAFADLLQQLVGADDGAGDLARSGWLDGNGRRRGRRREELARPEMGVQQGLDLPAQLGIPSGRPVEVGGTFLVRRDLQCIAKDRLDAWEYGCHRTPP
jgi:hypothetical protein